MIEISGFQLHEQLYESSHSVVYRGRRNADDQSVVLKILKREHPTPGEIARFKREYEITRNLNVEGVIDVYDLEQYEHSLMMILEDFGGGISERVQRFEFD